MADKWLAARRLTDAPATVVKLEIAVRPGRQRRAGQECGAPSPPTVSGTPVGTQLAERGAKLHTIMKVLGHSSVSMAFIYAQISDQEVLRDHKSVLAPGAVIAGRTALDRKSPLPACLIGLRRPTSAATSTTPTTRQPLESISHHMRWLKSNLMTWRRSASRIWERRCC
ncbi:hypothetical protein QLQ12_40175 [Actinoplanes sp. NEAU-A12]|uniref:Tyr recombinase domain-containing protein n=1 Tax=Actinoplanes sandaracinus TaxID=3045177 RepID=A0ABT6WYS0_9ACTN|nr:hypothetical protein [Actinoplanes sandaracinus]MDI6104824.1 hypothetical protein [Actinoplanes sandaracinus]